MSETRAWVEPIDGYPGFYRLCMASGDGQSRYILDDKLLQALVASANDARSSVGRVRRRGDAGNAQVS